ncbi:cob(I)yrinic acid a,c-diamide adenosyltransferase [Pendulispora albinea]|uniref:Corrinoid adenosyltransferase n=1 Tax=Pendulispora albinea TaxID=2741071 RepID=A0ABZ2LPI3_9BACT
MKIYTKTGDDGTTGLFGGGRVAKASARVDAYGTVDELNATVGLARAHGLEAATEAVLEQVQVDLFCLGAELACVPGKEGKLSMKPIDGDDIERLEKAIDASEGQLPPLMNFVLPGGSLQAASLHLARTVCRRAERAVLSIRDGGDGRGGQDGRDARDAEVRRELIVYLNRLSDLLFSLARTENRAKNIPDIPWVPRQPKG